MKIYIPETVKKIIERFRQNGFEAYAVGGCVRDSLFGKTPQDWDITTDAHVEDTKRCFSDCHIIETGIKHGTVTVMLDGGSYEITTYRVDGEYSDRRRPDRVYFTSKLEEDLARRDFTVNALACDGEKIIDCFNGSDDLKNGIIRCVGDADKRFGEDALRILRALRFSSVLGFSIEEKTAEAVHRNVGLLENVSAERIFSELQKLLCGKDVYRILMDFSDVFAFIIPEVSACVGLDQNNPYHDRDVWDHIAASVAAAGAEPVTRFAMLFHDMGKPPVKTTDENGISHFYGHPEQSSIIAEKNLRRLKCSNSFLHSVVQLVELHDRPIESRRTLKRLMAKCSPEQMRRLFDVKRADTAAHSALKIEERFARIEETERMYAEILAAEDCFALKDLQINGNDLMDLGVPQGKEIGLILSALFDEVLSDNLPNEKTLLTERAVELHKQSTLPGVS